MFFVNSNNMLKNIKWIKFIILFIVVFILSIIILTYFGLGIILYMIDCSDLQGSTCGSPLSISPIGLSISIIIAAVVAYYFSRKK